MTPGSGVIMAYYGTDNGTLGQLLLEEEGGQTGWTLNNVRKLGGVTAISVFDFTHDDKEDLVVGRDDGTIEAITFDEGMPKLLFSINVNECVMSVAAGHITDVNRDEIIATTFSGKVMGFVGRADGSESPEAGGNKANEKKVTSMRKELEDLHNQLASKKETLAKVGEKVGAALMPAAHEFKVHEKFMLGEDAMYDMTLEIESPIDYVMLQSDVELEIVQAENDTAVVNRCAASPEEGNMMVATYTCVENSNRLNLKIRRIEGQMGLLKAYIVPATASTGSKSCQCSSFKLKPLSLHKRVHAVDLSNHILSECKVEGSFSVAEVHSWISDCLPDMPDRAASEGENELIFQSTFIDTVLCCRYKPNQALFLSDSVSALSVLKEVISKQATKKKTQVHISSDIKNESAFSALQLIHPKLEHQHHLAKQYSWISGLKELAQQEADNSFLAPEYRAVIEDAPKIQAEFKQHPGNLQYLHGVVSQLFLDLNKFRGKDGHAMLPILHQMLEGYDFVSVVNFFVSQED